MHNLMKHIVALSLLAALTPACTEKGGETSDSSTGDTSGATDATTDAATDATTDAATDATGDVTGASDSQTSTDPTGGSDSDSTTGEPTTGEPGGLCEAYAAQLVMCGMWPGDSEAEIVMECEEGRAFTYAVYGPACGELSDAQLTCLTMAECFDDTACEAELDQVEDCLPEAGAVCIKYGEAVAACESDDPAELASSCQFDLNASGYMNPACGAAAEAAYDCFGGLSCEQLGEGTGCEQEAMAFDTNCGGEEGGLVRPGKIELDAHRR